MTRPLILGSRGTLGQQLLKLYPEATGWDREDIDATDLAALEAKVASLGFTPDALVNCIAFNDVDGAEDHPDAAFRLNAELPSELARFAVKLGIPFVTYSTNYVFDGVRGEYDEADVPGPLSVYGRSKLGGEELAAQEGRSYVVRTAVIFGPKGASDASKKSFVDLMLELSTRHDTIHAVADEINSVTYAPDLALATRDLLEDAPDPGIYHLANSGSASWFEFAREIFHIAGKPVTVVPVPSTHFPRKAKRPARAILLNTKRPPLREWKAALAEFLATGGTASRTPPRP